MKPTPAQSAAALSAKFLAGDATVGVVGLGYVGLPIVRIFHDAGFRVVGFDIDEAKIRDLLAGRSYLKHLGDSLVKGIHGSPRFIATGDESALRACDAIVICVPTPLGPHDEPDLSYVERSSEMVARSLDRPKLIVLTSTSYPGTTRTVCRAAIDRVSGRSCGSDYFLAFSPEREDPGRKDFTTRTTPRLVGGVDDPSTSLAVALFSKAVDRVIPVATPEVAEAAKLLENIYRAVNIALVNELKPVLDAMGIDIWQVIEAASTKPFGFHPFHPGPGLGGHCIPIDPFYLTWKAREVGQVTRFIELAGEINRRMPEFVVDRIAAALNDDKKSIRGAAILIIGLAYKPDVDDVRETPAAEIIRLLLERGAVVSYHDPHVPSFPKMRRYEFELRSTPLTPAALAKADCVCIVTHHAAVDWPMVAAHARLVVDTRNSMARLGNVKARVVKA